jgi:hypothetical protein
LVVQFASVVLKKNNTNVVGKKGQKAEQADHMPKVFVFQLSFELLSLPHITHGPVEGGVGSGQAAVAVAVEVDSAAIAIAAVGLYEVPVTSGA